MRIVSTSYIKSNDFTDPASWLERINFYTGILEALATRHVIFSIERINFEGRLSRAGVDYYFIKQDHLVDRVPFRSHKLIRSLKPDLVLVNGFIFPLQVIQLRWKLGPRPKIVIVHRAEKPFEGIRGIFQKWADRAIDAYLFTSRELATIWLEKGIIHHKEKVHEVVQSSSGFAVSDKELARSTTGVSGHPVYLWVGRLDQNKDPVTVVKAFIKYLQAIPVAKLYMIFQQEELLTQVRNLISDNQIASANIMLVGKIDHSRLQDWYNASDFIISGSHYEGSGIAVMEAMSCGCIPILTNIGSFRKITGPGKCGLLYEAGNEDSLLDKLLKSSKLERGYERDKVLQQFKAELSFDAIARKIENLFPVLTTNPPS